MGEAVATVAEAKALLEAAGYVVVKAKSYRQAQERQRVAEARRVDAFEYARSMEGWAMRLSDESKILRQRCTFLYGEATRLGATAEQLRGPA